MNTQVEPPEKRKRKTKTKNSSPSSVPPSSSSPSLSSLPDEIVVNCLAKISRSYYPTLSIVSKSFRSLVSSTELYAARSHLGSTEQCVYVCLGDHPQWFTLRTNPNRTLPDSMIKKRRKKKKTIGKLLVPVSSCNSTSQADSVVVGSEIYVIGGPVDVRAPSSAVRVLDCRSHTWRDAPSMIVARKYASACVYDGKIYVIGGCKEDKSWAEVFDTNTQTWELLPDPGTEIRKGYTRYIEEFKGKIQFENGINMHAYDTKQGKWELCGDIKSPRFTSSTCVVDNVTYGYWNQRYMCLWYDIQNGNWKEVKGLDSLGDKYKRNGGALYTRTKLVSCGGKLLLIWGGDMSSCSNIKTKIWCAEIALEKRDGGEVWGKTEWVDVVLTVPSSCWVMHGLAVSV